jgi:hypothetical protein
MTMRRAGRRVWGTVSRPLLALALLAPAASAALAQARTLADIAADMAPDRMQRLAADVRREGSLSLYTSRVEMLDAGPK